MPQPRARTATGGRSRPLLEHLHGIHAPSTPRQSCRILNDQVFGHFHGAFQAERLRFGAAGVSWRVVHSRNRHLTIASPVSVATILRLTMTRSVETRPMSSVNSVLMTTTPRPRPAMARIASLMSSFAPMSMPL